jgi:hypothetical protein
VGWDVRMMGRGSGALVFGVRARGEVIGGRAGEPRCGWLDPRGLLELPELPSGVEGDHVAREVRRFVIPLGKGRVFGRRLQGSDMSNGGRL